VAIAIAAIPIATIGDTGTDRVSTCTSAVIGTVTVIADTVTTITANGARASANRIDALTLSVTLCEGSTHKPDVRA
jgi:hypothetical protein